MTKNTTTGVLLVVLGLAVVVLGVVGLAGGFGRGAAPCPRAVRCGNGTAFISEKSACAVFFRGGVHGPAQIAGGYESLGASPLPAAPASCPRAVTCGANTTFVAETGECVAVLPVRHPAGGGAIWYPAAGGAMDSALTGWLSSGGVDIGRAISGLMGLPNGDANTGPCAVCKKPKWWGCMNDNDCQDGLECIMGPPCPETVQAITYSKLNPDAYTKRIGPCIMASACKPSGTPWPKCWDGNEGGYWKTIYTSAAPYGKQIWVEDHHVCDGDWSKP